METYRTFVRLTFRHAYYPGERCTALHVRLLPETERWLKRRKLFTRETPDTWTLSGPEDTAFDSGGFLAFELTANDPAWRFITVPGPPDLLVSPVFTGAGSASASGAPLYEMEDAVGCPGAIARIRLSLGHSGAGYPTREVALVFRETYYYWEYCLVPRDPERTGRTLHLHDDTNRLVFNGPHAGRYLDRPAWRFRSQMPVAARMNYDYQLRILEETPFGRKTLMKRAAYPLPGRFAQAERDCIRQVIYC